MNANAKVKKIFLNALLFTTISSCITGFSLDILVPLLNILTPWDIHKPVIVGGNKIYLSRFLIRLFNLIFALCVFKILTNSRYY